jgi:hypothetical protein
MWKRYDRPVFMPAMQTIAAATPRSKPMSDLSRFPIAQRWPAQHPDRIQLYSLNTPNEVWPGFWKFSQKHS